MQIEPTTVPHPAVTSRHSGAARRSLRSLGPAARDERGMATAEYAVGTVAAVALVTALIGVFRNSQFGEVLLELIIAIFRAVLGTGGLGL